MSTPNKSGRKHMPIGTITERIDGEGYIVQWLKTAEGWERIHKRGPIQKLTELKGRNPTTNSRTRNVVVNTANPDTYTTPKETGGRYVYCPVKRGYVYRKNPAA